MDPDQPNKEVNKDDLLTFFILKDSSSSLSTARMFSIGMLHRGWSPAEYIHRGSATYSKLNFTLCPYSDGWFSSYEDQFDCIEKNLSLSRDLPGQSWSITLISFLLSAALCYASKSLRNWLLQQDTLYFLRRWKKSLLSSQLNQAYGGDVRSQSWVWNDNCHYLDIFFHLSHSTFIYLIDGSDICCVLLNYWN